MSIAGLTPAFVLLVSIYTCDLVRERQYGVIVKSFLSEETIWSYN